MVKLQSKVIDKKQAEACMKKRLGDRKVCGLFVDTWKADGWGCFSEGMRISLVKELPKVKEERSWIFFKKQVSYTSTAWYEVANYKASHNCFEIEEGFEDLLDSVNSIVDYLIEIGNVAIELDRQRELQEIENRKRIASQFLGTE